MTHQIPVQQLDPPARPAASKIQPRSFTGRYRRIRLLGGGLLLSLYFGAVWVQWNGQQAILWDLGQRQFRVFGQTFWPQDLVLLSGILIVCAFGLFFMTVFAGRIWCGYSCPQSVWTWMFLWLEKIAEGDRNQRLRLDRAPLSPSKVLKRLNKHLLWLGLSLLTGLTFVGYFTPIRQLTTDLVTFEADGWGLFWVGFFTVATYLNAGWLREKVCFHMCPYGRFQSSMVDEDTLLINYDRARGETRGARKRGVDPAASGLGDCIDCQVCVQVCPTGIDIRNGLQMECIGCAACIDACDDIMEKMGYQTGLISYTSERALNGGKAARVLRPRLVGYGLVLVVMVSALAWGFWSRPLVDLSVAKGRGLFRYDTEGRVENSYLLKLTNKDQVAREFVVSVTGPDGLAVTGARQVRVPAGSMKEFPMILALAPGQLNRQAEVQFVVGASSDGTQLQTVDSLLTGPAR